MYAFFRQLYQKYYESLVAYAYHYVNNWEISEDIVQEVFLILWTKREDVDFTEPIKPYLYKAVYNKSMNHISSTYTQTRVGMDSTDEMINRIIVECNQYDTLLAKETAKEIETAINGLSPQCKKIFLLSREQHLKNKEIATLLEISEKAVEKQITKALGEIRNHLKQLGLLPAWLFLFFLK
ncbi:MAG: RNA polymerase sigma-70 factor [Tannerellaceae bacterium]|nr:RNA polymerase sigma-70 factor [Tannerellaceae bacterium]